MSKLGTLWRSIRDSLWFLPALLTAAGAVLSVATIALDRAVLRDGHSIAAIDWLFDTGAEGARGVLGVIASSLITVTGVVFSVTIVALQLASTQFTPRVLRSFMSDRGNQLVLGIFIGTFTYTLLVLRTVRSPLENAEAFVPSLSVALALLLALVSVGALIFYIDHIARAIQAATIIDRVARDARRVIERMFPDQFGRALPAGPREEASALTDQEACVVAAARAGYLTSIDEQKLFDAGTENGLVIRMEREVGDFVLPGEDLARVWPRAAGERESVRDAVRDAFVFGAERTRDQDIERGIIELVDIAVKALSPGINDPTTAAMSIDRLAELVAFLGARDMPTRARTGPDGHVVLLARRERFAPTVGLAFEQIRRFGGDQPFIVLRAIDRIGRAAALVPEERREPLREEIRRFTAEASRRIEDRAALDRIATAAREALAGN